MTRLQGAKILDATTPSHCGHRLSSQFTQRLTPDDLDGVVVTRKIRCPLVPIYRSLQVRELIGTAASRSGRGRASSQGSATSAVASGSPTRYAGTQETSGPPRAYCG